MWRREAPHLRALDTRAQREEGTPEALQRQEGKLFQVGPGAALACADLKRPGSGRGTHPGICVSDHQKLEREARICRLLKHPNIGEPWGMSEGCGRGRPCSSARPLGVWRLGGQLLSSLGLMAIVTGKGVHLIVSISLRDQLG